MGEDTTNLKTPTKANAKAGPVSEKDNFGKTDPKTNQKSDNFSKRKDQKDVLASLGIDDVEQGIIQGMMDESANKVQRKKKMNDKIDNFQKSDAGEAKEKKAKEDLTQAKQEYYGEKNKRLDLVGSMMEDILANQYGVLLAGGTKPQGKPYPEVLKYIKEMQDRYIKTQENFYAKAQDYNDDFDKECTFRPHFTEASLKMMTKEGDRIKEDIKNNHETLKNNRKNREKEIANQTKPINGKKSKKNSNQRSLGEDVVFYDRIMKWYDKKEKSKKNKTKEKIQGEFLKEFSPPKTNTSQTYAEQMRYVQKMHSHLDKVKLKNQRTEQQEVNGCFNPKTVQQRDRIVRDERLWIDNPVAVNGSVRLTNTATTYPRPPTKNNITVSTLQKDLLIDENIVNFIEYHNQREEHLVQNITLKAD